MPESNLAHSAAAVRGSQARRKISPFVQLAAARARRTWRIALPPMPRRPLLAVEQAAIAAMRAAELAAWQASGGDALRREAAADQRVKAVSDFAE